MKNASRLHPALFQLAGVAVACLILSLTFRDVRIDEVSALIGRIGGAGAALVLLPQLLSAAFETYGWRLSWLAAARPGFLALLRVRVATESAAACLPAGVLVAESLKLPMLVKCCGTTVPEAVSAVLARKYLLLSSQALYIGLALVFGWAALEAASRGVVGREGLPLVLLVSCLVVAAAALSVRLLLSQGGIAARVRGILARVPIAPLRRALSTHRERFAETDGCLEAFFRLPWRSEARITVWFVAGWTCEAVETFLILKLLGVELSFFAVASFEVALSLLRSLVFVVPAGLGLQDAGYVIFLRALGVPDAATLGAAFSLIKRSKEVAWAAFGFALLTGTLSPAERAQLRDRSAPNAKVLSSESAR